MDIQLGRVLTNNSEVRGHNPLASIHLSREPSLASSVRSTLYHDRMDMDLDNANVADNTDNGNPELSYETEQEKALRVGEAAYPSLTRGPQVLTTRPTQLAIHTRMTL